MNCTQTCPKGLNPAKAIAEIKKMMVERRVSGLSDDLPILNPAEARMLGSLIEKKELTPDVYPLSLNGALAAANQKTAREPVMALAEVEVHRALKTLAEKGLVRQVFASRVERYEHLLAQKFSLTQSQIALVGLMLLARTADGA